ncbi:adenylate/guanylate cyclase [Streptomyces sp. J2-1]|uniref:adenylate/guanylate cyclase n=1 Tax=Streptomyces corallincola TaxID=2851888 RepID=UPI001C39534E|nr:adenylate/guanylate cyclase [Streptomyces corallincola]MBV2354754.1 adenylate/guanylate cyclase [Streptomyces corallincola]
MPDHPDRTDHPRHPEHTQLLLADIKGFSTRSDREQLRSREDLNGELRAAFTEELWRLCDHEDRGDAVLVVMRHAALTHALFTEVLPRLEQRLGQRRRSDPLLRLRMAVHAGSVHTDAHGYAGNAVNHVFRLCEGEALRQALDEAASDTALLVSDAVHDSAVRAGLPGVDPATFHSVPVRVKETSARAWLHVAGDDPCARRIAEAATAAERERDGGGTRGVSMTAGRDNRVRNSVISGGDTHLDTGRGRGPWWRGGR